MEFHASYCHGEVRVSAINDSVAFLRRIPDSRVRLTEFIKRKTRQVSALLSREDLKSVLALQDKETPEDANYKIGDTIHTLLGGCVPARYQIYGVNTGGYGIIYTVLDQDTLTPYCLKTARRRFLDDLSRADILKQEARTWLRLAKHPNIVYAHSLLEINGYKSILLEYVPGGDLSWRIRKGALPLNKALNYGIQFCRGMRHAQTMMPGLIHGDIKPGNCLVTEAGTLKITDFGHVGRSLAGTNLQGNFAQATGNEDLESYAGGGTPSYMAPELFDGSSNPDSRIDVYAFGIMLYEMITGHRPFPGKTYAELAEQHCGETPLAAPPIGAAFPQRLSDLMTSCLARSPEQRPQDFCIIDEALSSILWELNREEIPPAPSESLSVGELIDRGSSFSALGLYDEALKCFNSVLDANSQSPLALNYKAQVSFNCGHDSEAAKCLERALNLNPRLALTWNNKGQALSRQGNNPEALGCFERAVALDPRLSFAWSNKGRVLGELGRLEAASKALRRALSIDPYQATAHNNQGIIFYKQGLDGEARATFKRAISLNPLLADAYGNLGDTNRHLGLTKDAIQAYREALKLSPELATVRENLSLAYREVYSASSKYLDEQYATRLIAFLLDDQTDSHLVLSNGLDLLRVSGFDPVVLYLGGEKIYHALEEIEEIEEGQREAWVDALDHVRNNSFSGAQNQQTSYWLGKIFYGLDLYDQCTKVFQQSILLWGPDDRSLYHVAACDEVRGRYAEALDNYRQALLLDPRCHLTRAAIVRVESQLASLAAKQSGPPVAPLIV